MTSPLTFPRSTFAKLSPHPFLLANLQPSSPSTPASRTNGRAHEQPRHPHVNTSSLSHAHGSAVVRAGDTTVICGVRGEILPVANIPNYRQDSDLDPTALTDSDGRGRQNGTRELKDYDLLVPNIELATGCAPQFLPGVPPTALAQTLSTRVYSLLHSCGLVGAEDLRIWHVPPNRGAVDDGDEEMAGTREEGKLDEDVERKPRLMAYWTLYIDLLFISYDGNPFDAAWAAMLAALRDTRLPKAWWDADREMAVCSRTETKPLTITGLPIACSAAVFLEKEGGRPGEGKNWLLLDPDRLEESLCDETITIVVDRSTGKTRIRSLSKAGGTVIQPELIRLFTGLAEQRWEEFRKVMN